jgi:hypothetical protein
MWEVREENMKKKKLLLIAFFVGLLIPSLAWAASYSYHVPYAIADEDRWSGLALKNGSLQEANVTITVREWDSFIFAVTNKVIPARGQDAFVIMQNDSYVSGWVMVVSDRPLTGLCFVAKTGSGSTEYMADISLISPLSTGLSVPHVAQDDEWDTHIRICNPHNTDTIVTLEFLNPQGQVLFSKQYRFSPNSSGYIPLETLVDYTIQSSGSVEISSTQGIAAFALYYNLKTGGYCYSGISAVDPNNQYPTE